MNCSKIPITTSSPLWFWYLNESFTEQGENIITGAPHPLTPPLFIKGEFLRVFGICLWVAEIITLKALMRPDWASKFVNLYEILNSWGINIARWESGQPTYTYQLVRHHVRAMGVVAGHRTSLSYTSGSFQALCEPTVPILRGKGSSRAGYELVGV